jgi:hypothetical protein
MDVDAWRLPVVLTVPASEELAEKMFGPYADDVILAWRVRQESELPAETLCVGEAR